MELLETAQCASAMAEEFPVGLFPTAWETAFLSDENFVHFLASVKKAAFKPSMLSFTVLTLEYQLISF